MINKLLKSTKFEIFNLDNKRFICYHFNLKGKTNEMTRAEKYDFKNVWFGTLKKYINYE